MQKTNISFFFIILLSIFYTCKANANDMSNFRNSPEVKNVRIEVTHRSNSSIIVPPQIDDYLIATVHYDYFDPDGDLQDYSDIEWYFNEEKLASSSGKDQISIELSSTILPDNGIGFLWAKVTPHCLCAGGMDQGKTSSSPMIYVGNYINGIPRAAQKESWSNQQGNHGFFQSTSDTPYFASTVDAYVSCINSPSEPLDCTNTPLNLIQEGQSYSLAPNLLEMLQTTGVKQFYSTQFSFAALLNNQDEQSHELVVWGQGFKNSIPSDQVEHTSGNGFYVNDISRVYAGIDEYVVITNDGSIKMLQQGNSSLIDPPNLTASELSMLKNNVQAVYHTGSDKSDEIAFAAQTYDGKIIVWGDKNVGGELPEDYETLIEEQKAIRITATDSAFAVILGTGNVLAWGDPERGGLISSKVTKRLRDVRQIVATKSSFASIDTNHNINVWGSLSGTNIPPIIGSFQSPKLFGGNDAFLVIDSDSQNGLSSVFGNIPQSPVEINITNKTPINLIKSDNSDIVFTTLDVIGHYTKNNILKIWGSPTQSIANIPDIIQGALATSTIKDIKTTSSSILISTIERENIILSWNAENILTNSISQDYDVDSIYTTESDNLENDCYHIVRNKNSFWDNWDGGCQASQPEGPSLQFTSLTASPEEIEVSQNQSIITMILKDSSNNEFGQSSGNAEIRLSNPVTDSKISATTNHNNGQYTAILTSGSTTGTETVSGWITTTQNGKQVLQEIYQKANVEIYDPDLVERPEAQNVYVLVSRANEWLVATDLHVGDVVSGRYSYVHEIPEDNIGDMNSGDFYYSRCFIYSGNDIGQKKDVSCAHDHQSLDASQNTPTYNVTKEDLEYGSLTFCVQPADVMWEGSSEDTGHYGETSCSEPVEITDTDEKPILYASYIDPIVEESSNSYAEFYIGTRDQSKVKHDIDVFFAISGDAKPGIDFEKLQSPVTLPAGSSSIGIKVYPIDDNESEVNEKVVLTLLSEVFYDYTLDEDFEQSITIYDDDED
ncbi:hypothetical protein HRJ45_23500 [Vibrio coralliilyticus]|uniref:Ig-like domain-containing protein n=1 Tax=Vibrio coralliilyticus TaxID=190893 RepID=UPI00156095AC|nr:Ig-like domain-containing protein [Vibrio coralliilyticus]NRF27957.1 hypothetical protein [Vibrio coralliilyticus]NRF82081.1 hypothetical protein [Vibrio coralliilyticus]